LKTLKAFWFRTNLIYVNRKILVEFIGDFFLKRFVIMVGNLLKYPEIFKKYFMESVVQLSDDKVINVRITLAKVLKKHYHKKGLKRKKL